MSQLPKIVARSQPNAPAPRRPLRGDVNPPVQKFRRRGAAPAQLRKNQKWEFLDITARMPPRSDFAYRFDQSKHARATARLANRALGQQNLAQVVAEQALAWFPGLPAHVCEQERLQPAERFAAPSRS